MTLVISYQSPFPGFSRGDLSKMEVSWNGGTPKSSKFIGFSMIYKPSILWIPHLWKAPTISGWSPVPHQVRMALDRRNYRQLVDTTVEIANKVTFLEMNCQLQTTTNLHLEGISQCQVVWFVWLQVFRPHNFGLFEPQKVEILTETHRKWELKPTRDMGCRRFNPNNQAFYPKNTGISPSTKFGLQNINGGYDQQNWDSHQQKPPKLGEIPWCPQCLQRPLPDWLPSGSETWRAGQSTSIHHLYINFPLKHPENKGLFSHIWLRVWSILACLNLAQNSAVFSWSVCTSSWGDSQKSIKPNRFHTWAVLGILKPMDCCENSKEAVVVTFYIFLSSKPAFGFRQTSFKPIHC